MKNFFCVAIVAIVFFQFSLGHTESILFGDGKVVPPRDYKGSLEEVAQEAIIIFSPDNSGESSSIEHLILKIRVEGKADQFAWVIPFPNEPQVTKEDVALFKDCFDYVQARKRSKGKTGGLTSAITDSKADSSGVEVLSRQIVGDFDVAVVRESKEHSKNAVVSESEEHSLNAWLKREGFQPLTNADDVLDFYRQKNYVYACIKVSSEKLASSETIESHPLRFTFETGGCDGIFFPMKLTGLQQERFDVNLYVFYQAWLNKNLNKFGYENRGFELAWRDVDGPNCNANAGKNYSNPGSDPYLWNQQQRLKSVTRLMQKIAPGERFYLTNIQSHDLNPADVRDWSDDLWLFPHYTDPRRVPEDVLGSGPASLAWPNEKRTPSSPTAFTGGVALCGATVLLAITFFALRQTRKRKESNLPHGKPTKPAKPIDF